MTVEELQQQLEAERTEHQAEIERLKTQHEGALAEQRKIIDALMKKGNNGSEEGDKLTEMQKEIEKINKRRTWN